jgi:hypothetical protein
VRRLYPFIVVGLALAVGVWSFIAGGRESISFLMLATVALGWVVWLLFRAAESLSRPEQADDTAQVSGRRRKELEREKAALLKAIKELEFDHEMGKVSDRDFADIGQQYRARAIRVMRQLDEGGQQYEALIAKELAARLKKPIAPREEAKEPAATPTAPATPAALASKKSEAASTVPSDGRIVCKSCGTSNDGDAEFCKKCGARLAATETAS